MRSRAISASAWVLTTAGLQLGQFALGAVGVPGEDLGGDHQTEHGVAEELEPLVGGQAAVLVGVAAVGQREGQQIVGQVDAERLEQRRAVDRHSRSPSRSGRPSSTGFMAASLAQRGSMTSWWCGSASRRSRPARHRTPGTGPGSRRGTRRERQLQPDGVDDRLLEVDGVVDDAARPRRRLGGGLGGAVRVGEQLGEVDLDVTGDRASGSARTPRASAPTPCRVTSTPSDTDSRRRSRSTGAPSGMAISSMPMRDGAGTVSPNVIIEPGRLPSREMSSTKRRSVAAP